MSDIQDYFKHYIKRHETVTQNPPIRIYVSQKENRITLRIKTGYYLELLTSETMKLVGSTKFKITNYEKGKNMLYLESTELVLVQCNIVSND